MTCTVTVFGKPLAGMTAESANMIRPFLYTLDDCEDCSNYIEATELGRKWYEQKSRLFSWGADA